MPECRVCKFKFHKELKGETTIITLIETKTQEEVGYVRFEIKPEYVELEYLVSFIERKEFGSKLVRVVKAIAKGLNKPIYIDAFNHAVGFWIKNDFIELGDQTSEGLIRMRWKA